MQNDDGVFVALVFFFFFLSGFQSLSVLSLYGGGNFSARGAFVYDNILYIRIVELLYVSLPSITESEIQLENET